MRTTVTLEDDLAETLRQQAHERDVPFKRVLNDAIRIGLSSSARSPKPFRMKPSDMGIRPGIDLIKANQLAADLEDEEIIRKLEQGR